MKISLVFLSKMFFFYVYFILRELFSRVFFETQTRKMKIVSSGKSFEKTKTLIEKTFKISGEIIYRVELPDMEQITLIYLENSDADYCKSEMWNRKSKQSQHFLLCFHFCIFYFIFCQFQYKIQSINFFHFFENLCLFVVSTVTFITLCLYVSTFNFIFYTQIFQKVFVLISIIQQLNP